MRDSRAYGNGPRSAVSANDVNALEPVVLQARFDAGDLLALEVACSWRLAG